MPKRTHSPRPRDRSFEAYVVWLDAFVARFMPRAPRNLLDSGVREKTELSWRNYWATLDRNERIDTAA